MQIEYDKEIVSSKSLEKRMGITDSLRRSYFERLPKVRSGKRIDTLLVYLFFKALLELGESTDRKENFKKNFKEFFIPFFLNNRKEMTSCLFSDDFLIVMYPKGRVQLKHFIPGIPILFPVGDIFYCSCLSGEESNIYFANDLFELQGNTDKSERVVKVLKQLKNNVQITRHFLWENFTQYIAKMLKDYEELLPQFEIYPAELDISLTDFEIATEDLTYTLLNEEADLYYKSLGVDDLLKRRLYKEGEKPANVLKALDNLPVDEESKKKKSFLVLIRLLVYAYFLVEKGFLRYFLSPFRNLSFWTDPLLGPPIINDSEAKSLLSITPHNLAKHTAIIYSYRKKVYKGKINTFISFLKKQTNIKRLKK